MNAILKQTLDALEQLPEAQQQELAARFQSMVARARIDAMLAEGEARGGETPHDQFFAELKALYVA